MNANITSVGKFLPKNIIKNSEFENFLDTTDEWIRSRTGIEERRRLDSGKASSYMAIKAIEKLIKKIKLDVHQVDCIIVSTITPDIDASPFEGKCLIESSFKNLFIELFLSIPITES